MKKKKVEADPKVLISATSYGEFAGSKVLGITDLILGYIIFKVSIRLLNGDLSKQLEIHESEMQVKSSG